MAKPASGFNLVSRVANMVNSASRQMNEFNAWLEYRATHEQRTRSLLSNHRKAVQALASLRQALYDIAQEVQHYD